MYTIFSDIRYLLNYIPSHENKRYIMPTFNK